MFKHKERVLIAALVLTPIVSMTAIFAGSKDMSIYLYQAIDANCDGKADQAFSMDTDLAVQPQQCVNYKITASNNSNETLNNVVIKGIIPEYTTLIEGSAAFYIKGKVQENSIASSSHSAQIHTKATTLESLKAASLFYSVKVD